MPAKKPAAKKQPAKKPRASRKPVTKPWTVLVYMVTDSAEDLSPGKSKLDSVAKNDAMLMWKALRPHSRAIHVAIQADLKSATGTYRWILGQEEDFRRESLATTTRALDAFFEWGRKECPAKRYAVLFWGHSAGPMGLFSDTGSGHSRDELSLSELRAGLRHMSRRLLHKRPIDIVLFKNCFQAILETGFEIRDSVRFMLASQALIPSRRWPYDVLFASLTHEPTERIAHKLLDALGQFYSRKGNRDGHPVVPFSLLDLQAFDDVVVPMKALVAALLQAQDMSAEIRSACERAWLTNTPSVTGAQADAQFLKRVTPGDVVLVDMRALCNELFKLGVPGFSNLAQALGPKIERVVVGLQPVSGAFRGVSAYYFPPPSTDRPESLIGPLRKASVYQALVCSRKTHWDKIALEN